MRKLLLMVLALMLTSSIALAAPANWGLVNLDATIGSIQYIYIGQFTGEETINNPSCNIVFSKAQVGAGLVQADWYSNLMYKTNVASTKVTVANVSTSNTAYCVDGLVNWNNPSETLPLQVAVMPFNPSYTTVNVTATWQTVYDSQRYNSMDWTDPDHPVKVTAITAAPFTGTVANGHVLITPTPADLNKEVRKDIYYQADFTNAKAAPYGAVIQYSYIVE